MGRSFVEDFAHARQLAAARSSDLIVGCLAEPCTIYEDLDGDGSLDMAFQVINTRSSQVGVGVVVATQSFVVVGAGLTMPEVADQLGRNLLSTAAGTSFWSVLHAPDMRNRPAGMSASMGIAIGGGRLIYWNGTQFTVANNIQQ